jgi:hypothetical protein
MRRVVVALGALGGLALLLAGCGDDEAAGPTTTRVTTTLGEPFPVGTTYEDPSGNVTLTVRGIRLTGDLLLADAEACAAADGLPALPVQSTAWQLRLEGREQTIPQVSLAQPNRAARPPWPETPQLAPGDCVEGKVAFRVPPQAQPAEVLFTQLATPVSWTVRG